MVFDSECMLTDPVSMLERRERERMDTLAERRQHVNRYARWLVGGGQQPHRVTTRAAPSRRFAKLEQTMASADGARVALVCKARPFLSESEARTALALCKNDERRAVRKLNSYQFVKRVRQVILPGRGWLRRLGCLCGCEGTGA